MNSVILILPKFHFWLQVDIADVSDEIHTYALLPQESCDSIPWLQMSTDSITIATADPRVESFAWRVVASDEKSVISSKSSCRRVYYVDTNSSE